MKRSSWSLDVFLSCFSFHSFDFQPVYAGRLPNRDRDSPPANLFDSGIPSPSRSPCQCAEYLSRISNLEGDCHSIKQILPWTRLGGLMV
jgi:hypothetical protein